LNGLRPGSDKIARVLGGLWRQMSPQRRRQLFAVLAMTVLGAIAEVVTLGALLPFLALIANPDALSHYPGVARGLAAVGLARPGNNLLALTIFFSAAAVIAGAIRVVLARVTNQTVFSLGHELSVRLFERILYEPYSYHLARNSSSVLAALYQVQTITAGVLMPILQSASAAIIGLFITVALFIFSPMIALVVFAGFGAIYCAVSVFIKARLSANARMIAGVQSEGIRSVLEGLGGIRDVLIDGTQQVFLDRFRQLNARLQQAQAANYLAAVTPRFAIEAAGMVLIAGLACVLLARTTDPAYVLPILGTVVLGAQRLLPLMQLIYGNWTLVIGNLAVTDVVLAALEAPFPEEWRRIPAQPLPFRQAIVFRDVSFRYGTDQQPVVTGLDFTIAKGAKVGLMGRTGSGKSTAMDLLMGLLEPSSGSIEIDGCRLDATTRRAWQRQIAHVPQHIFLADASIAENIAFGVEPAQIDRERVRQAAQRAAIAGFIESLPQGYATLAGERGVRLSGGQRQRIGIARALYKQAMVLVFDEATSALDTETEAAVLDAVRELPADLTVLIVAHRLTTVEYCDHIVTLDGAQPPAEDAEDDRMPPRPEIA